MSVKSFKTASFILSLLISLAALSACDFGNPANSSIPLESGSFSEASALPEASADLTPPLKWPSDNEFVSILPNFNGGKITEITQGETNVLITIKDVEKAAFDMYVTALKGFSFTNIVFDNETVYSATKPDTTPEEGVTVRYYSDTKTMTIDVSIS